MYLNYCLNPKILRRLLAALVLGLSPCFVLATDPPSNEATLNFTQALDGATFDAGSDIPITVNADELDRVRAVRLFVNGQRLSRDRSAPYEWPSLQRRDNVLRNIQPGTYTIRATATQRYGVKTSIYATFTVQETEQSRTALSFAQSLDGAVFDTGSDIVIGVNAEDPDGIRSVRLFVNDQALSQDRQAPYKWPSSRRRDNILRNITTGTYTVEAMAIDGRRNRTSISATFSVEEPTQEEQPLLAWADSYSVGDQCYCLSDFDQGIAEQVVSTPYGDMTVPQLCADIGPGPGSDGQPLYNDIQCGNGPANTEANEASCPGRVDSGAAGCSVIGPTWKYPDPVTTKANPPINDGPLRNPLKGFHIGFDETCCLEAPQEVYFGNFMASVGYQNFNWADLEPTDDQFDWSRVDNELSSRAGSKQKHVIVQLNAEWTRGDTNGRTPEWFLNDSRYEQNVDEARGYKSHKYESAFYQEEVKEFIAEFINRFRNDPRIFVIQIGMVGYFGELNVFPNDAEWLPENIKVDFFNHYRDHMFGKVDRDENGKLVVLESAPTGIASANYNGISALTQARYPAELAYNIPTAGIGYTNGWVNLDAIPNDGNNDDDIGNKDFNDPIDLIVSDDGRRLWELGPIGGEWPPNRLPGVEGLLEEWTLFWGSEAGGGDYIRRGHYSFARPPQVDTISQLLGRGNWSLVPENWNFFSADAQAVGDNFSNPGGDRFRSWHRQMGYNYQLSDIQHYLVANNSRINISFIVDNIGLAPFYFDWNVEMAILDAQNQVVQLIPFENADMRTWAAGERNTVSVTADINADLDLSQQDYKIALRMSQPGASDVKNTAWRLDADLTYVVISNDVEVIDGVWDDENKLVGGWNVLDLFNN